MKHAPAVRIGDDVADVEEPPEQGAEFQRAEVRPRRPEERPDRVLEALAPDEPHGVIRPTFAVGAQRIDRDDAGMLQAAGHLGLHQKSRAALGIVGQPAADLLQGHLAVEDLVERHEDLAESPRGVGPDDPVAAGRRLRRAGFYRGGIALIRSGPRPGRGLGILVVLGHAGHLLVEGQATGWRGDLVASRGRFAAADRGVEWNARIRTCSIPPESYQIRRPRGWPLKFAKRPERRGPADGARSGVAGPSGRRGGARGQPSRRVVPRVLA